MEEKKKYRFADAVNKLHNACGGTGKERVISYHYLSDINGVECVNVLER